MFITTAAASKFPHIIMLDYSKLISNCNLIDTNLTLSSLDRIFLAASLDAHVSSSEPSKKMLSRNQFIESLIRCAQIKYQMPKTILEPERSLSISV